jgi:hypothetical protein
MPMTVEVDDRVEAQGSTADGKGQVCYAHGSKALIRL